MVRRDGVLVLKQELDGAREEIQWQRDTQRNREQRPVGNDAVAFAAERGLQSYEVQGRTSSREPAESALFPCLKRQKTKARRSSAGGGIERSAMKPSRKPRRWEEKWSLLVWG